MSIKCKSYIRQQFVWILYLGVKIFFFHFVRVFNWISHSHTLCCCCGHFLWGFGKKMSQQRNEIINESTDKNAHKFISAIIRLIRLFCVQATTDFCSVGLFFFSFSFQEFQFYLWICAACLFVVGGTGIKKKEISYAQNTTPHLYTRFGLCN